MGCLGVCASDNESRVDEGMMVGPGCESRQEELFGPITVQSTGLETR